ncbi:MAG: hypothetical protein SV686_06500 [Thermodesulfobacteriota bacterium]|nr:hypothetical protein [Thermodesulfobacteriota bacterium]
MATVVEEFREFLRSDNVKRHIEKFYEHMPDVDDIIISILKGHMLIEEQLSELIIVKAEKPNALKDSRLSFYQILCIAEAFLWYNDSEWVWSSCRKLNSIRNSLSHELEPKNLQKNIRDFLNVVEKHYPPPFRKQAKSNQSTRLLTSIGMVHATLSAYLEACRNTENKKKNSSV